MSKIEDSVIAKIQQRAEAGKAKYGVTMERGDLTRREWLVHAQEEAMDLAVYLEKLIQAEPVCQHGKRPELSYCAFFEDADRRRKRGEKQRKCKVCKRYVWDEFWNKKGTK